MRRTPLKRIAKSVDLQDGPFPYLLSRSRRRKTIAIHIEEDGEVRVVAPVHAPQEEIERFMRDKEGWMRSRSHNHRRQWRQIREKKFAHGQRFLFMGKKYELSVFNGEDLRTRFLFDGRRMKVCIPRHVEEDRLREILIRKELLAWYRYQAREIIGSRVFHYCRLMKTDVQKIAIREQKRIWGSCHPSRGVIHLNWRLIFAPIEVIDYVVVHELCHLKVANHSRRFWRCVQKVLPDYKLRQRWFKSHSVDLALPLIKE